MSNTSAALFLSLLLQCYFAIFNVITRLYYYFLVLRRTKTLLLIGSFNCRSNVGGAVAGLEERQHSCQTSAVVWDIILVAFNNTSLLFFFVNKNDGNRLDDYFRNQAFGGVRFRGKKPSCFLLIFALSLLTNQSASGSQGANCVTALQSLMYQFQ